MMQPEFFPAEFHLPRQANGRLDFPSWSADHQANIEILEEHGKNLEKVATECVDLGMSANDWEDMLEQWSWTWICATLIYLRARARVAAAIAAESNPLTQELSNMDN